MNTNTLPLAVAIVVVFLAWGPAVPSVAPPTVGAQEDGPVGQTLTYYLHGTDIAGIADGYTMNATAPASQPLALDLLQAPHWLSDPPLTGTFEPGASFALIMPCTLGLSVAPTYSLALADAAGNEIRPLGQVSPLLGLCLAEQQIIIPVATPVGLSNQRLKLTIGTAVGVNLNLLLGTGAYLRATGFAPPTPTLTATNTPTPTATPTPTPTVTRTLSPTATATAANTPIPTATATRANTVTATSRPTPSRTTTPAPSGELILSNVRINGQPAGVPPGPLVDVQLGGTVAVDVRMKFDFIWLTSISCDPPNLNNTTASTTCSGHFAAVGAGPRQLEIVIAGTDPVGVEHFGSTTAYYRGSTPTPPSPTSTPVIPRAPASAPPLRTGR